MKTETLISANTPEAIESRTQPSSGLQPHPIRLNEILVPIDFSQMSYKALQYAVSLAAQYGARVTLLHVVDPAVVAREFAPALVLEPRDTRSVERELSEVRQLQIPESVVTNIATRYDTAAEGILEAIKEFEPDLVVISTHGRSGLKRIVLGSTAEKVVRGANCPVLVVRETERDFV